MPVHVLEDRRADVGAFTDVQQIEQRGHGDLMAMGVFAPGEEEQPVEQVFDPQQGAYTFIAGVLVQNHAQKTLSMSGAPRRRP